MIYYRKEVRNDTTRLHNRRAKAELKRRNDLIIAKKAKIKKCKMCKHWGEIDCVGAPTNNYTLFRLRRCCKFFKGQTSKLYISHLPSQDACVHFEKNRLI